MFPGLNPRKVQQMMKQMGIQQIDIPATEVIIKGEEKDIIISKPEVAKVNLMGRETFQISGEVREEEHSAAPEISEEDIETVMERAGVSAEKARKAIEAAGGDLARAIINLNEE